MISIANKKSLRNNIFDIYLSILKNFFFDINIFAIFLWLLIAIKAITFFDISFDSLYYHLPFASRLAGIFPKSEYIFYDQIEPLFDGMPKLAEFVQGVLWRSTGLITAPNLVGYFCVLSLTIYVSHKIKIPFWIATLFFMSVPLVLLHSASSYTDLPANCFLVIAFVNLIAAINQNDFGNKNLFFVLLPLDIAANIKFQAVEIAAPFWVASLVIFLYKNRIYLFSKISINKRKYLVNFLIINFISAILFGANYFVNTLRFGNPFYPLSVQIGNLVFDGPYPGPIIIHNPISIQRISDPKTSERSSYQNYLLGLSELTLFTNNNGELWSVGMGSVWKNNTIATYKTGGFFIGNLILWFSFLIISVSVSKSRNSIFGFIFIIVNFLFVGFLPAAILLRYWLFLPLDLAIIVFWISKDNPIELKSAFNLVIIIQLFLFSFIVYQNTKFFSSVSNKITFSSPIVNLKSIYKKNKIEKQFSDFVCIIGNPEQGLLYKIANPGIKIESSLSQNSCKSTTYFFSHQ